MLLLYYYSFEIDASNNKQLREIHNNVRTGLHARMCAFLDIKI
jgi:hypothetical protein